MGQDEDHVRGDTEYSAHLKDDEKQRLDVLDARIERKKLILADIYAEKRKIIALAKQRNRRSKTRD